MSTVGFQAGAPIHAPNKSPNIDQPTKTPKLQATHVSPSTLVSTLTKMASLSHTLAARPATLCFSSRGPRRHLQNMIFVLQDLSMRRCATARPQPRKTINLSIGTAKEGSLHLKTILILGTLRIFWGDIALLGNYIKGFPDD